MTGIFWIIFESINNRENEFYIEMNSRTTIYSFHLSYLVVLSVRLTLKGEIHDNIHVMNKLRARKRAADTIFKLFPTEESVGNLH